MGNLKSNIVGRGSWVERPYPLLLFLCIVLKRTLILINKLNPNDTHEAYFSRGSSQFSDNSRVQKRLFFHLRTFRDLYIPVSARTED